MQNMTTDPSEADPSEAASTDLAEPSRPARDWKMAPARYAGIRPSAA